MNISTIIFYILSAMVLGGAVLSVTSKKILRAAIYLLFSLIGIAGIYFFLSYEFIAAVQIVVYVGGIVVLIIFSIFLTHGSGADMKSPAASRLLFSGLASFFGFVFTYLLLNKHNFYPSDSQVTEPTARNIGAQMLDTSAHGYLLPFEMVSILLLAAMIGCIVIAIKGRES